LAGVVLDHLVQPYQQVDQIQYSVQLPPLVAAGEQVQATLVQMAGQVAAAEFLHLDTAHTRAEERLDREMMAEQLQLHTQAVAALVEAEVLVIRV
jgi:hypothetical protein